MRRATLSVPTGAETAANVTADAPAQEQATARVHQGGLANAVHTPAIVWMSPKLLWVPTGVGMPASVMAHAPALTLDTARALQGRLANAEMYVPNPMMAQSSGTNHCGKNTKKAATQHSNTAGFL